MKKALAVVLCLCMVTAILAGCSKNETPSSSGISTSSSSTPSSSGSAPASSDEPAPSGGDDLSPAEKAIAERKESGNCSGFSFLRENLTAEKEIVFRIVTAFFFCENIIYYILISVNNYEICIDMLK